MDRHLKMEVGEIIEGKHDLTWLEGSWIQVTCGGVGLSNKFQKCDFQLGSGQFASSDETWFEKDVSRIETDTQLTLYRGQK